MFDSLFEALFEKLPRPVKIGLIAAFWLVIIVGLVLILLGKI